MALSSALTERGCSYSFSLKFGQSFNFMLKSGKGAPPKAKPQRSPSYFRRQLRRHEDFLKRRSGSSEKNVDADSRHNKPNQNEKAEESNSDDSESESGSDSLGGGNLGVQLVFDPADELTLGILMLFRAANHLRSESEFGGKDAG